MTKVPKDCSIIYYIDMYRSKYEWVFCTVNCCWGRGGHDRMVVGFSTTCAIM